MPPPPLPKRLTDSSAAVRRAAIQALGIQGNWRLEPAQEALIKVATDKTWNPEERGLAVDALGVAAKMEVRGFYQDPAMFQALVKLLDEDDASLRTKAFAILSPIPTSTYKPEATPDERRAAIATWQTWVDNITAKK